MMDRHFRGQHFEIKRIVAVKRRPAKFLYHRPKNIDAIRLIELHPCHDPYFGRRLGAILNIACKFRQLVTAKARENSFNSVSVVQTKLLRELDLLDASGNRADCFNQTPDQPILQRKVVDLTDESARSSKSLQSI